MSDSILTSTKKILGIAEDYTAFDLDVITHINSAFATLHQLGIGPSEGIRVEDDVAVWDWFFEDQRLNQIKSYVYLRVRMLFDPPGTSFLLSSMEKQVKEMEWRLMAAGEIGEVITDDDTVVLDGGNAY